MGNETVLDKSWDNKSHIFLLAAFLVALTDTSSGFLKNLVLPSVIDLVVPPDN